MGTMASQIASLTIVFWTVYSGADRRKHHPLSCLWAGNSPVTGEFPAQRASNGEMLPFDDVIMSFSYLPRMIKNAESVIFKHDHLDMITSI